MKKLNKNEKNEIEEALTTMQTIVDYGGDNFLCKEHRSLLQILINYVKKHYQF